MIAYATIRNSPVPRARAFREPVLGPEFDVVSNYCLAQLPGLCGEHWLTVFVEPKIEGSYPDIVAAFWDPAVTSSWPAARARLLPSDIPHLHHLSIVRRLRIGTLNERLGFRQASEMVERFIDAEVADFDGHELRGKPIKHIYAVKRLIAIEAKMHDWRRGLEQAYQATWFASESYLLLRVIPRSAELLATSKRLGIGVVAQGQHLSKPEVRARPTRLPASHASWIFNEWAWRHAHPAEGA